MELESYPAPSIILANVSKKSANQEAESTRKLDLGSNPQDINDQLRERPGVVVATGPPLRTSQQIIERVGPAPAILLANVSKKVADWEAEIDSLEDQLYCVPDPPPIVVRSSALRTMSSETQTPSIQSTPKIVNNTQLRTANHIHNGVDGDEKWW